MRKISVSAAVFLSGILFGPSASAWVQEHPTLISKETAENLGVNFPKIKEQFSAAGYEVHHEEQFLAQAHEEDEFVDLSTLDGISITVPIHSIVGDGVPGPRNLF